MPTAPNILKGACPGPMYFIRVDFPDPAFPLKSDQLSLLTASQDHQPRVTIFRGLLQSRYFCGFFHAQQLFPPRAGSPIRPP